MVVIATMSRRPSFSIIMTRKHGNGAGKRLERVGSRGWGSVWEVSRVREATGPERFCCSGPPRNRSRMRERVEGRDKSDALAHLETDQGHGWERIRGGGGGGRGGY